MRHVKLCAAVIAITAVPEIAQAQTATTSPNVTTSATSVCTADKVRAVSMAFEVPAPTGYSAPSPQSVKAGTSLWVKATIKNLCTMGTISIPYVIVDRSTTLSSGSVSVPAGQTTTVSYYWKATGGAHGFNVIVDPANTFKEPNDKRQNNTMIENKTLLVSW